MGLPSINFGCPHNIFKFLYLFCVYVRVCKFMCAPSIQPANSFSLSGMSFVFTA